jgi:hypothetical protein
MEDIRINELKYYIEVLKERSSDFQEISDQYLELGDGDSALHELMYVGILNEITKNLEIIIDIKVC